MLGRRGPGHHSLGFLVRRQLGLGHDLLQGLQKSGPHGGRGAGIEESVDRIDLQHPLFLQRDLCLHLLQHLCHQAVLRGRGIGIDSIRARIEHKRGGGHQLAQYAYRRIRISHLDRIDPQFGALGCRRGGGCHGLGHGFDHRGDHGHDPRRIGNHELLRCRDGHDLAIPTQQRSDCRSHGLRRPSAYWKRDRHQLELAAFTQVVQAYLGGQAFWNTVLQIDHHQHPITTD